MRVFAGPNGSGKSTLNMVLPPYLLGVYVNADEIELSLKNQGLVDMSRYGLESPLTGIQEFLSTFEVMCGPRLGGRSYYLRIPRPVVR